MLGNHLQIGERELACAPHVVVWPNQAPLPRHRGLIVPHVIPADEAQAEVQVLAAISAAAELLVEAADFMKDNLRD